VIWARDMGKERNAELIDYFANRQVWLLEADIQDLESSDCDPDTGARRPKFRPYADLDSPTAKR
ncbi:MAG TPA: hypothetical protein VFZ34_02270, partial [Blastocatellia bacterium]|nr:hypothetical protein [Blastocatellia bacterium]